MNNKSRIVSLLLLLVLVAVYTLWLVPVRDEKKVLDQEISTLQSDLGRLQEAGLVDNGEVEAKGGREIDGRLVAAAVPNKFDQDAIIEQFSRMSRENNLNMESLTFSASKSDSEYITTVSLSLNVSGGLFNFLEFLHDIEAQNRFFLIRNFNLSLGGELPIQINFAATIETYHA